MRFAWALLALSIAPAVAQDYCSLEVRVVDEQGKPVPAEIIRVVEDADERLSQGDVRNGVARFCDLGVGLAHVRVGASACRSTRVERVELKWRQTVRLTIVHDLSDCNIDTIYVGPGHCSILLRFETEDRKPVSNVRIESLNTTSDRAGHLLVRVDAGKQVSATATAPGYAPAPIQQSCLAGVGRAVWRTEFVTLTGQ